MGKKGKEKRQSKKELRAQRKAEQEEQQAEFDRTQRRRRWIAIAVPVVTLAAAAGFYWGLNEPRLSGAVILGGAVIWLLMATGFVGATLRPRDRMQAGNINYGTSDKKR